MIDPLPCPSTSDGAPRRVGIEIEFMGPSVRRCAEALAGALGGRVDEEDRHAYRIRDTALGDLAVELDLRHVHPDRRPRPFPVPPGRLGAAWLGHLVAPLVPRELILGPIEPARLGEIDRLAAVLRRIGATGDGATRFAGSLGLHFNIDPPDLAPATAADLLAAYMAAEPALRRAVAGGDEALRRVLAPPFPPEFQARSAAAGAPADWATLARRYLAANPTRDRGLDLLPLLLDREPALVRAALPREKIAARPVLHYRLPLAHVGDPDWSVVPDWNRWVAVERNLADRRDGEPCGKGLYGAPEAC